ncbi:MAG: PQQ-binding-like beta-propeller repeat protein [Chloroflexia bacterium]
METIQPGPQPGPNCGARIGAVAVAATFGLALLATVLMLSWTLAAVPSPEPSRGEAALYRKTEPSGDVGFLSLNLTDPQVLALRPSLGKPLLALKGSDVSRKISREVIFYVETPAGRQEAGFLQSSGLYTYSPTLPLQMPEAALSGTVTWSYGPWRRFLPLAYTLRRRPAGPLSIPAGTFSSTLAVEMDVRLGGQDIHHRVWYARAGDLFPLLQEESGPAGLTRYELLSATGLSPRSGSAVPADEVGCSGATYLERGGPERSGAWPPLSARPALSLRWQAAFPSDITAPPLCAGGLLLLGDEKGVVRAVDVLSGEVRWTWDAGRPIVAAPAVSGGIVYIAAGDRLYALEASRGLFLWSASANDRIVASPLIYGDLLFFGTESGTFYALEARDGVERWRFEAGDALLAPAAGSRGLVLFGDASGLLYALDAVRGDLRWEVELEQSILPPPTIAGETVYIGLSGGMEGGRVVALALADGTFRWSASLPGDVSSALTLGDDAVYAVTGLGHVVALGREDGRTRWQADFPGAFPQAPLLVDRTLILADSSGSVHLLDGESGQAWAVRNDLAPVGAPPAFCQGLILLADRHRHVYALGDPAGRAFRLVPRWDRPAVEESSGAGPVGSPQAWAGRALLLLDDGDLRLYDPLSGEFTLLAELGGLADLPPLVHGDTAYIALSHPETGEISTTVVAYDLAGQQVRWRRGVEGWLRLPPSATSSHLILCLDTLSGSRLRALDTADGTTLWQVPLPACTGAPWAEEEGVFLSAGHLEARDPADGTMLWQSPITFAQGTPLRCGGTLYTGFLEEEGFFLAAFDARSGRRLWRGPVRPALFLRPACDSTGRVFVGWSDGLFQAYAGDTGEVLWSHDGGDLLLSDLVVGEGAVYGITGEGALVALDAESGRLLARYTPPYTAPALAAPLVMDGRILFADRIFLYALEVVHE